MRIEPKMLTVLLSSLVLHLAACASDADSPTRPSDSVSTAKYTGNLSISLSPSALKLATGDSVKLTVKVSGRFTKTRRLVPSFVSVDTSVARVDANGEITAVTLGSTSIVGTLGTASDTATVAVVSPDSAAAMPVAAVTVDPGVVSLVVGTTGQLTATTTDSTGSALSGRSVTWAVASPAIATVSSTGLVQGVAVGSTRVTATSEGHADTVAVSVVAMPVASVTVTATDSSLTVGGTTQLTATMRDSSGTVLTGRAVTWTTSSAAVATVSGTGLVTAVSAGAATVSATSEGQRGSLSLTVAAPVITAGGPSCSLVTDLQQHPAVSLAKPGYLQSAKDPVFGTTITRITGDPGSSIPTVGGTWGTLARQEYAKDAAWSADQQLIVLKKVNGDRASHMFLDGNTYAVLMDKPSPGNSTAWHPTQRDVMIYVTSSGTVGYWNVRTDATDVRFSTSGYSSADLGHSEGNPSRDGRWVVVTATRNSDGKAVAFAVDLSTGQKYPDIDPAALGYTQFDWASISPLGTYVVLTGYAGTSLVTRVFTPQGSQVASWVGTFHFDLGVDGSGAEVAFGASNADRSDDMHRLSNGARTVLTAGTYAEHHSTRNTQATGWGFTSTYQGSSSTGPFINEIFAVELDPSGSAAVRRLAHHYSTGSTYDAQPQAVPSPDGTRVLFASDWGNSGGPIQGYVVDTRCP